MSKKPMFFVKSIIETIMIGIINILTVITPFFISSLLLWNNDNNIKKILLYLVFAVVFPTIAGTVIGYSMIGIKRSLSMSVTCLFQLGMTYIFIYQILLQSFSSSFLIPMLIIQIILILILNIFFYDTAFAYNLLLIHDDVLTILSLLILYNSMPIGLFITLCTIAYSTRAIHIAALMKLPTLKTLTE